MILGELNLTKLDERFRRTDRFLMEILKVRLANGGLSDAVAENKRKESKGEVYSKRRLAIDLGCATGVISFDIASRFKKVIGYDISPDMVAVANRKKLERGLGNLDFINKDIESGINLPDNSVSLAIMNMGTGSDLKNTKGVIAEIKRVLRPSGKFLISFYNAESLLNKVGFIPWPMTLSAYVDPDRRCLTVSYENNVYFLYARSRTVEEVKTLLSEFEVDVCTYPTLASILPNILTENCDGEGNHQPNEEE